MGACRRHRLPDGQGSDGGRQCTHLPYCNAHSVMEVVASESHKAQRRGLVVELREELRQRTAYTGRPRGRWLRWRCPSPDVCGQSSSFKATLIRLGAPPSTFSPSHTRSPLWPLSRGRKGPHTTNRQRSLRLRFPRHFLLQRNGHDCSRKIRYTSPLPRHMSPRRLTLLVTMSTPLGNRHALRQSVSVLAMSVLLSRSQWYNN